MYVEITKAAFNVLVDTSNTEDHGSKDSEIAIRFYYYNHDLNVSLLEIYNKISGVWQYYIKDINS